MEDQRGARNGNQLSLAQVHDILQHLSHPLKQNLTLFQKESVKEGEALREQLRTIKRAFGPAKFNFMMLEEQEKAKIEKAERLKNPNKRKAKQVGFGDDRDDEDCRPMEPESMFVKVFNNQDEKWNHILDFFASRAWRVHVDAMTTVFTRNIRVDFLNEHTTLKPWQKVGVAKLLNACDGPLKGLILGDETGLGKTLEALVAARVKQLQMKPHCGFILVVCRPGCVFQWEREVRTHLRITTVAILNSNTTSVWELLQFDVLICSSTFLKARYTEVMRMELFSLIANTYDIALAREMCPGIRERRIKVPLHSELYQEWNKRIPVVIFDEAHDFKNEDTLAHKAALSLDYHHAFLLTATPMYNSWTDVGGIVSLLPGSPFLGLDHYKRTFAAMPPEINSVARKGPEGPFHDMMIEFLRGLIVARPKAVLQLPDPIEGVIEHPFSSPRVTDLVITAWSWEGREIIWGLERKYPRGSSMSVSKFRRAMSALSKAQGLSLHPALLNHQHEYGYGKQWRSTFFEQYKKTIQPYLDNYLKKAGEQPTALDDLSDAVYMSFKTYLWNKKGGPPSPQVEVVASNESEDMDMSTDDDEDEDASPNADESEEVSDGLAITLRRVEHSAMHDELFDYGDDEMDRDCDPENGLPADEDDQDGEETSDPSGSNAKSNEDESTIRYKQTLKSMTNEELESPRVNVIIEKVLALHRSAPTEKVIVGSASVKFLNIINEVLTRKAALGYPDLIVYEFNGSIKSVEKRTNIADSFNLSVNEGGPTVLLLSAACGGVGLNLHGGSHIIIAESFWQPGLRTQLIGRAHRMPQAKQVYVYDVKIQTPIDDLKHEILSSKSSTSEPMVRGYQRHDQDGCPAAALPTKEQVGEALAKVTDAWKAYHAKKSRLRAANSEGKKKKKQKNRQDQAGAE